MLTTKLKEASQKEDLAHTESLGEDEYCEVSGVKLDKKPERKPHKCPVCDGIDQIQTKDIQ